MNGYFNTTDTFTWRKESFDCDDFALSYKLYMKLLHHHHHDYHNSIRTSVAIGEMHYTDKQQRSHAIIVAIILNNNLEYEKLYIEPQTGKELMLTKQEEYSTWYVGF